LTSTVAPTSSSFFFMSAASALATFSFTGFGAPSTRSLASFRPRPVSSRTTLMTWIFLSPAAFSTTSNSVFSSAPAPAAAAPPAVPVAEGEAPAVVPRPGAPAPPAPRELYSQAYADYARGNFDLAIQEYQEYLKNYPETDLSDNAQYWIGECLYSKQQYAEALEAWDELFRRFPGSDKQPDARYKKGMALERLGRKSQAQIEYRAAATRYPNSEAGRKAREKLNPQQ